MNKQKKLILGVFISVILLLALTAAGIYYFTDILKVEENMTVVDNKDVTAFMEGKSIPGTQYRFDVKELTFENKDGNYKYVLSRFMGNNSIMLLFANDAHDVLLKKYNLSTNQIDGQFKMGTFPTRGDNYADFHNVTVASVTPKGDFVLAIPGKVWMFNGDTFTVKKQAQFGQTVGDLVFSHSANQLAYREGLDIKVLDIEKDSQRTIKKYDKVDKNNAPYVLHTLLNRLVWSLDDKMIACNYNPYTGVSLIKASGGDIRYIELDKVSSFLPFGIFGNQYIMCEKNTSPGVYNTNTDQFKLFTLDLPNYEKSGYATTFEYDISPDLKFVPYTWGKSDGKGATEYQLLYYIDLWNSKTYLIHDGGMGKNAFFVSWSKKGDQSIFNVYESSPSQGASKAFLAKSVQTLGNEVENQTSTTTSTGNSTILETTSTPVLTPKVSESITGEVKIYISKADVNLLKIGSKGQTVAAIQAFLNESSLYTYSIDGHYMSYTETAVKKWQQQYNQAHTDNKIMVDGFAGEKTLLAMELIIPYGKTQYEFTDKFLKCVERAKILGYKE